MVIADDRLRAARPGSWRARRATSRLRRLARLASAGDVNEVRARVERTTHITELVLPAGTTTSTAAAPQAPETEPGGEPPVGVKVPGTAWRVSQWIDTWVAMCADGKLVFGPINDDQHARTPAGRAPAGHLRGRAGHQPGQRQGAGGRLARLHRPPLTRRYGVVGARLCTGSSLGTRNVQERSW